jgi:hypothetical protein
MDSQDIIRTGRRAKSETEAFINRYLNDRAKGWPKLCLCSSVYTACPQGQPAVRVAGQQAGGRPARIALGSYESFQGH